MRLSFALAVVLLSTLGVARAGDLNPPSGPVAPTGLRLDQIEPRTILMPANAPFVITAPGSYALGGPIKAPAGAAAITIQASGVSLDLHGFSVQPAVQGTVTEGIALASGVADVEILGGLISGFSQRCISGASALNVRLTNLTVKLCGATGAEIGTGQVTDSHFALNTGDGLRIAIGHSVVRGCTSSNNVADGFDLGNNTSALNSVAQQNSGFGFLAGDGGTFSGCTSRQSSLCGYRSGAGAAYVGCSAFNSGVHGFEILNGATLTGCDSRNNAGDGFNVSSSQLVNCTARTNSGNGARLLSQCSVFQSQFSGNLTNGIFASGVNGRISGNHTSNNSSAGIRLAESATAFVLGNTAHSNTAANFVFPATSMGTAPVAIGFGTAGPHDNISL